MVGTLPSSVCSACPVRLPCLPSATPPAGDAEVVRARAWGFPVKLKAPLLVDRWTVEGGGGGGGVYSKSYTRGGAMRVVKESHPNSERENATSRVRLILSSP